jgi:hypothetical protein
MKVRLVYALMLAVALCAVMAGPALADAPVVTYDDTEATTDFVHKAGVGGEYVRNGAFDDWAESDGMPIGWKQYVYNPAGEIHWAKMDYADPRASAAGNPNYALGLFVHSTGTEAPGYGITYSPLAVSQAGDYWVVVHATAWGQYDDAVRHNSEAWYAIYPTDDPTAVPESAWRELYPDSHVCENHSGFCNNLARKEVVHIEPGSYIFLRGEMKFPDWQAWTVFGWDDIAIWDLEGTTLHTPDSWVDDGDVTWDPQVTR